MIPTRLLAAAVLAFPLAACSASSADDDNRATAAGLTILEADGVAGRLTAVYADAGRSVRFEVRRGALMHEPYLEPAAAITHEMDGRVLDQEGRPFYLQFGGDTALDPTWKPGPAKFIDVATRRRDMQRAIAAASALAAWNVTDPALVELRATAIAIARVNGDDSDTRGDVVEAPPGAPTIPTDDSPALGAKGYITADPCGTVANWSFAVWKKSAAIIAEHSAIMLRGHNNGSIVVRFQSCNHGACAGADNMSFKCDSVKYPDDGSSTRKFYSETSDSTGSVTGGCLNDYDASHWAGGEGHNYGHNCHNDSKLQRYAIRYDHTFAYCTRTGDCNSLCVDMDAYAPDCY